MRTRTQRAFIALALLSAAGAVIWLGAPLLLASLARTKLQAAAAQAGFELRVGSAEYRFPLTLRLTHVRLFSVPRYSELLFVDGVTVSLAKGPLGSGPLQITRIELDRPSVSLDARLPARPASQPSQPIKPSDWLQIQKLSIRDGKVSWGTTVAAGALERSNVWRNINTELRLAPSSTSTYKWEFVADSSTAIDVAASGTIDVDTLELDVADAGFNLRLDERKIPAAVPPPVAEWLERYNLRGQANLNVKGRVPLRDPATSQFSAAVAIPKASATVGGQAPEIDGVVNLQKLPHSTRVEMDAPKLTVAVAGGSVAFSRLSARVDAAAGAYEILALSAKLSELAYKPSGFERPIEHISGLIQLRDDALVIERLGGKCGDDSLLITTAQVPLAGLRSQRWPVTGLVAEVDLQGNGARFPGPVGATVASIAPRGKLDCSGHLTIAAGLEDYDIRIQAAGIELAPFAGRWPMSNARGEMVVNRNGLAVRHFVARSFDGTIAGTGAYDASASPPTYRADVSWQQIELEKAAAAGAASASKARRLRGQASGSVSLRGIAGDQPVTTGDGELSIVGAELWEIPILARVAEKSKLADELLVAGEAAALFEIRERSIHVKAAAFSTPALGVQGSGDIGPDERLDLELTAFPLGDWEKQIKETGIPVLADAVGNLAGAVQRLLDTATRQLIYQFRVRGTLAQPRLDVEPSPILTDAARSVLGHMIRKERDLLEAVRKTNPK